MARRASSTSSNQIGFTIVELLIVIVVIAILAAITIVAYNGVTEQARISNMKSELAQWKKKSELHKVRHSIECPEGYAFVYGNSALGTNDFCVMKYEAKDVGGVATSQAIGTPWTSITQSAAITAAAAIGGHLITEAEWMTIAADTLSVKYNWTGRAGGTVGSGAMYTGHNDNSPAAALAASIEDDDGYFGTGNSASSGAEQGRTLYLTSGDVIWDFSGNVYEWTQQAIGVPTLAISNVGISGDSGFVWRDYTNSSLSFGTVATSSRPSAISSLPGLDSISPWNSIRGVGRIFANYADVGTRAFIRGGGWATSVSAGVLNLHVGFLPSNSSANVGFRVVR